MGCTRSPTIPVSVSVFPSSHPSGLCSAFSLTQIHIYIYICCLVYSLNWPYPLKSLCTYIHNSRSKSRWPKTICIYFTHHDWSIVSECGFVLYIFQLICLSKCLESEGLNLGCLNLISGEILLHKCCTVINKDWVPNCCRKRATLCLRELSFVNVSPPVFVPFCQQWVFFMWTFYK